MSVCLSSWEVGEIVGCGGFRSGRREGVATHICASLKGGR